MTCPDCIILFPRVPFLAHDPRCRMIHPLTTTEASARRTQAYRAGVDAVRQRPYYAPRNPYDYETEPMLQEAWEDGATAAGMNDVYTNGVINAGAYSC